jgi:dephospho-CoA kinase
MKKFVVGLTGGIGSGKTTVASLFSALGISVVNADLCSRIVVEPGRPALNEIVRHFGASILQADETLDRAKLRSIIFQQAEEKTWLENLLHPLIHDEIQRQLQTARSAYAILESPLLVETGQKHLSNRVLVVDVDEEQQLRRTMQRDNNSEALVRSIMNSQASRTSRNSQADDIIHNYFDLVSLQQQVAALHTQYLEMAHHHAVMDAMP